MVADLEEAVLLIIPRIPPMTEKESMRYAEARVVMVVVVQLMALMVPAIMIPESMIHRKNNGVRPEELVAMPEAEAAPMVLKSHQELHIVIELAIRFPSAHQAVRQ